jgi:hypothetical protein
MYHDYAQKQQLKMDGAVAGGGGNGRNALFGLGGFALAKLHSRSRVKALKRRHAKEQKQLYTQYYNDVYKMQESVNEYASQAEQYKAYAVQVQENAELEALQRDYVRGAKRSEARRSEAKRSEARRSEARRSEAERGEAERGEAERREARARANFWAKSEGRSSPGQARDRGRSSPAALLYSRVARPPSLLSLRSPPSRALSLRSPPFSALASLAPSPPPSPHHPNRTSSSSPTSTATTASRGPSSTCT